MCRLYEGWTRTVKKGTDSILPKWYFQISFYYSPVMGEDDLVEGPAASAE